MSGYVEVLNPADITRIWKAIHDAVRLSHAATAVLTPGGDQAYLVIPRFFVCALGRSTEAWTYLRSGPGRVDMDTYDITLPTVLNRSTADASFPRTLSGIPGKRRGLSVAEIGRPFCSGQLYDAYAANNFIRPNRGGHRRKRTVHTATGFSKENHNRGNGDMADSSSDGDTDSSDDDNNGASCDVWQGADILNLTQSNKKRRSAGEKSVSGSAAKVDFINRNVAVKLPLSYPLR
jgi:hypothetical protein